jgi:hypothetical protein
MYANVSPDLAGRDDPPEDFGGTNLGAPEPPPESPGGAVPQPDQA